MPESLSESGRDSPQNDYLTRLIQSISTSQTNQEPSKEPQISATPQNDLISSLLSNPELISKLPTLISTIKPIFEMLGATGGGKAQETASVAAATTSRSEEKSGGTTGGDRRSALLCAMKPYLCKDRRDAIDYVIKLSRLGDVLKTL